MRPDTERELAAFEREIAEVIAMIDSRRAAQDAIGMVDKNAEELRSSLLIMRDVFHNKGVS